MGYRRLRLIRLEVERLLVLACLPAPQILLVVRIRQGRVRLDRRQAPVLRQRIAGPQCSARAGARICGEIAGSYQPQNFRIRRRRARTIHERRDSGEQYELRHHGVRKA